MKTHQPKFVTIIRLSSLLVACAATAADKIPAVPFSRFIGPDDCPGSHEFADPYVLKQGDAWYLTSTYGVGAPMVMFKTTDWKTKTRLPLSIDLNLEYLRSHFKSPEITPHGIWGFTPYRHKDGGWHAYASISVGNFNTFICHFRPLSSTWPITQWRLDKVMIGTPTGHTYETKVYADDTGGYLFYVDQLPDGNNHIMVRKLRGPDELVESFAPRPVLSPEGLASEYRNGNSGIQICEGPNITRISGKYAMLYSVGDFAGKNYKLGVAYSDTLVPPAGKQYVKLKAADPTGIWGNPGNPAEVVYLLQTEKEAWPNYHANRIIGPGLGNLVGFKQQGYLVFHAHDIGNASGNGNGRWTWICPVSFNPDAPLPERLKPVPAP